MAGLHISPELDLPLDAVTETFAILAKRRAGKSNAAVVMAEEMYDAGLPWVAIDPKGDWWGIRASGSGGAPGLSVLVFGGTHGDVPLTPTSGRLVADLVAQRRLTCVLDVSEMSKADQRRFLIDFADHLYRTNTEPLHVFCEEADEYIPQRVMGENAKLVGVFETLVKRGGFRGIGVTLITQRSASLNKDVLTQIETLIPMRTPSPQDRKAILAWVEVHAAGAEAVNDLPGLANGEAYVFSPQWLDTLTKITFRRRRTFDSGATPKVGDKKPRRPTVLAAVDIAAIEQAMAETIEQAKTEDPKHLRVRVRTLEKQLAEARGALERAKHAEPVVERVEVPVVPAETLDAFSSAAGELMSRLAEIEGRLEASTKTSAAGTAPLPRPRDTDRAEPPRRRTPVPAPAQLPAARGLGSDDASGAEITLRTGARRMVESLGRMAPLRLTKSQWGTVAKLKTSGGTWSTYLSDIRRAGLLDEDTTGYTLSKAGFDFLGEMPEPMAATELQDHYRTILRSGAARMLDALLDAHPEGLTRDELSEAGGVTSSGGTFSTYLSDLTRNGLAARRGGLIFATDILIFGADAQ